MATPTAESLGLVERSRLAVLESFSGLSTLITLESILHSLSNLPNAAARISSKAPCDELLPLVHSATWQLAPATLAEMGRTMAYWRQAVASLLPTAQSALLATEPFSPDSGSSQAVADALARAHQLAVVYRGQGAPRSAPPRGRSVSPIRQTAALPTPAPRCSRQEVRLHPYGQHPARPSTSSARTSGPFGPPPRASEEPATDSQGPGCLSHAADKRPRGTWADRLARRGLSWG